MEDKDLAAFAQSGGVFEDMQRSKAEVVIDNIIKEAGCTSMSADKDDLVDKGMEVDYIDRLVEEVEIEGVHIEWQADVLHINVDKAKYEKGAKLSEGSEYDNLKEDYFVFPKEIAMIEDAIKSGMNVLLIGPAGCGKTELGEILTAKLTTGEHIPFNMTEETTTNDFLGQYTLKNGDMEFIPGPMHQAMTLPATLQIDEVDVADPGILFVMQRALERKDVIVPATGDRLKWKEGCRFIATANTAGRGEQADIYRGRQILDEAFLDRWDAVFRIKYMPANEEIKMLRKRAGMTKGHAKKLVDIAGMAREGHGKTILGTFSTRKVLNVAKWMTMGNGYSMEDAFKVVVLNKATDEDAQALAEIYQRIVGKEINMGDR